MTDRLQHALRLQADGFYVFPLKPNQKTPAHKGWQNEATRDAAAAHAWFSSDDGYNIGIFTGRFGDDQALLVVDVDNKGEKNGNSEILRLELEGHELPDTAATETPTGGRHLFFAVGSVVPSSVDRVAVGLDVRSKGGYVVGAGSRTNKGEYRSMGGAVAPAPTWLVERCGKPREKPAADAVAVAAVDPVRAVERATRYLKTEAPESIKGQGGDQTAYKVAARVKDYGVDAQTCHALMLEHWFEGSGWSSDRLWEKVSHAYQYGVEAPGAAAPENDFSVSNAPVDTEKNIKSHPFDELNKKFAYIILKGEDYVLWEDADRHGRPELKYLSINTFHRKHAAQKITVGKKESPVTVEWMEWGGRRSYDGLVFEPAQSCPPRYYNLWRGFSVEPKPGGHKAVDMWLEHARLNVCRNDPALFSWFLSYFAHLVQKPWVKPLVALVLRGDKGVGKNALLAPFGQMLGGHYLLTANRRYLIGNFNGHLENLLLFVLDEAFWSGDKQAEGTLKDLVTGADHLIEHKGKQPYTVENKTRIVIIGNEDWLVPASWDERRYAVFQVGDGRKQDGAFFGEMERLMAAGGAGALLHYLQNVEITADVHRAPNTEALLDQKHASLDPFPQWWLSCLSEGRIAFSDFGSAWPSEAIDCERFRAAFRRWARERNIRNRIPDDRAIGKDLKKMKTGIFHKNSANGYVYKLPDLAEARKRWNAYIGHEVEWSE